MRTPAERAKARNAALRQAVRDAFPGVSFTVRNGRRGSAAVSWTDGPVRDAVREVVHAVPTDTGAGRWSVDLRRKVSVQLVACAYLRCRAEGSEFYLERDPDGDLIAPGDVRSQWQVRATWWHRDEDLDATTLTSAEVRAATFLARIADQDPTTLVDDSDDARRALGRALYHHGHVLDAVLTETSALTGAP